MNSKQPIYFLLLIAMFLSCKKDEIETTPLTSFTMVNAVVGGAGVKLGNNTTTVANTSASANANTSGTQMSLLAGENDLYLWPVGDSLHPYFVQNKFVSAGRETYSVFLCGLPGATEGIVIKENIPYRTDSTAGIRFINLSPNSTPLNITLSTSTTVNEVSNLAYKQYTDYKSYPGLYNSAYTFQVRAAANPNTVLASFALTTVTVPRFANITVVIREMPGSPFRLRTTRVNQDR